MTVGRFEPIELNPGNEPGQTNKEYAGKEMEAAKKGSEMLTQAQARMTNPEITLSQKDKKETQLAVLKHMINGLDLESLSKDDLKKVRSAIFLIDRNLLDSEDDIEYFNKLQIKIDALIVLAEEKEKNKKNAFRMAESFVNLDLSSMDNVRLQEVATDLQDFLHANEEDIKSSEDPKKAEKLKEALRRRLAYVQEKLAGPAPTKASKTTEKEIPPPLKSGGLVREYGRLGEDARKARIKKMFRYLDQDKLEARKKEFAAELKIKRKQESREAKKEARRKKKGASQEQQVADRKAEVLAKMTVTENPQEKPVTPKDIMDHVFVTAEQKAEWETCKNKKIRERAVYGHGRGFFIRKYKTVSNLTRNLVMVTNMGPKLGTLFIGRDTYGEYIERALKEAEKMGKLKELVSD